MLRPEGGGAKHGARAGGVEGGKIIELLLPN